MKVHEFKKYECEICHKQFNNQKDCEEHENKHIKVVTSRPIASAKYDIEDDKGYPSSLIVKMENGDRVQYFRKRG